MLDQGVELKFGKRNFEGHHKGQGHVNARHFFNKKDFKKRKQREPNLIFNLGLS